MMESERPLVVSKEKLADVQRRIQDFQRNANNMDALETEVSWVEAKLKSSEKHARFLEIKVSEQRNEVFENNTSLSRYLVRVVVFEQVLKSSSVDAKRLASQYPAVSDLHHGDRTDLTLYNTCVQPHGLEHTKYRAALLDHKDVAESNFYKFLAGTHAKVEWIQPSLDSEARPANASDSECLRLLVSDDNFNRELQLSFEDS